MKERSDYMVLDKENSRLIKSLIVPNSEIEYLDCLTTTGPKRERNEDFAATIISPSNNQIKLLIVCDGVGSDEYGEQVSEFVTTNLVEWFNTFNFNDIDFVNINKIIVNQIRKINRSLSRKYKDSSTTLTMALVGETQTLIINRGDSRTYSFKDNKLTQITKDDSFVWDWFYKNGKGKYTKDELRFLKLGFYLTKSIGSEHLFKINANIIDNNSYDGLLLLTDGITNIVSDKKIEELLSEKEYLIFLKELLTEACYGESEFFEGKTKETFLTAPTLPGKDNATAAMYLKIKK